MGLKEKRYEVLNKRISNDKTQKVFLQGEIFTSSEFSHDTISHWLKEGVIKEVD